MGRRNKRKGGGNSGSHHHHSQQRRNVSSSGSGTSASSLFTSGFINPAFLTQHAALAASSSSSAASPIQSQPEGAGGKNVKKRKREQNNVNVTKKKKTKMMKQNHDENNENYRLHNQQKRKQQDSFITNNDESKDHHINDNDDKGAETKSNNTQTETSPHSSSSSSPPPPSLDTFIFGHPKWRRIEQLCYHLLFPPTFVPSTKTTTKQLYKVPKIVFVSSSSSTKTKKLANLFKPMLSYPKFSFACHTKVKRNQLRTILTRMVCGDNDAATNTNSSSTSTDNLIVDGGILFVHDKSIKLFKSVCKEVLTTLSSKLKKKNNKKKKSKQNISSTESTTDDKKNNSAAKNEQKIRLENKKIEEIHVVVAGLYYDQPQSQELLYQRRNAIQSFAKLFLPVSPTKLPLASPQVAELILDGTLDKKIDVTDSEDEEKYDETIHTAPYSLSSVVPKPTSLYNLIASSDRPLMQALVNASERLLTTADRSSDRARSAHDRLKANLAVLDVRLTSGQQNDILKKDNVTTIMKKMKILGMICDTTVDSGSTREAALTQWLDGAHGQAHGGEWCGPIRQGASGEEASRKLAALLEEYRLLKAGAKKRSQRAKKPDDLMITGGCCDCNAGGKGTCWPALSKWQSNPAKGDSIDALTKRNISGDEEGGKEGRCGTNSRNFGNVPRAKACGHNETTMFFLRPFAALEVLNSRVCSRLSPAPGNAGFEGCQEFLQRVCAAGGRGMTFWDSECFAFIDGKRTECQDGTLELAPVSRLLKKDFLHLSCETLIWLIDVMREWTVYREASTEDPVNPRKILDGINFALGLLQNIKSSRKMPPNNATSLLLDLRPNLLKHILSFVFPGNLEKLKTIRTLSSVL